MKNRLFLILFFSSILFSKLGYTQDTTFQERSLKYFNKTEAGFAFGVGSFKTDIINNNQKTIKNDELVFTLQTINGFKYMNKLAVGISLGAEIWHNALLWPICAYIGYDFKPAENTMFANIFLGSAMGTRKEVKSYYHEGKGAFAFTLGVGYKMRVSKKLRFSYEVFYKYQAMNSSYDNVLIKNDTIYSSRTISYKVPLSFAGFKIGINFP
ncbi:MAG: hypothetical protein WCL00_07790 [Bacteroidota bacterium]